MNVLLLGCSPASDRYRRLLGPVTISELPWDRHGFVVEFFDRAPSGAARMTVPIDVVEAFLAPSSVSLAPAPRTTSEYEQYLRLLEGLSGAVLLCAAEVFPPAVLPDFGMAAATAAADEWCQHADLFDVPPGHVPAGMFVFPDAGSLLRVLQEAVPLPTACAHPGAPICAAAASCIVSLGMEPLVWAREQEPHARSMPSMGFNRVTVRDGEVVKEGELTDKIRAEHEWFLQAPPEVSRMLPGVLDGFSSPEGNFSYRMELLDDVTLGEKLVFSRHDRRFWDDFFSHLAPALDDLSRPLPDAPAVIFKDTYLRKTIDRIGMLSDKERERFDSPLRASGRTVPGLARFMDELPHRLEDAGLLSPRRPGYVHGDLFAGNMFFAPGEGLRLIDPRGSFPDCGWGGDPLYDVLKLSQSFLGRYDAAWFGRMSLEEGPEGWRFSCRLSSQSLKAHKEGSERILRLWCERSGLSGEALRLGTASLLVASSPLHRGEAMRALLLVRGLSLLA